MTNTKIASFTLAILGLLVVIAVPSLFLPACVLVALFSALVIFTERIKEEDLLRAEGRHAYNVNRQKRVANADSRYKAAVAHISTLKASIVAAGCEDTAVLAAAKRAEDQCSSASYFLNNVHWRDFFMDWRSLGERLQAAEESADLGSKLLDASTQ